MDRAGATTSPRPDGSSFGSSSAPGGRSDPGGPGGTRMSNDKTEKPTRRRRADARKQGQSPRSAELAQAVSLVATFVALPLVLSRLVDVLIGAWHNALTVAGQPGAGADTGVAT